MNLSLLYFLILTSIIRNDQSAAHVTRHPNVILNDKINYGNSLDASSNYVSSPEDKIKNYTVENPLLDPYLAIKLDSKLKECITKLDHLTSLLLQDKLKCDVESITKGPDQSLLVQYAKQHILSLLNLPSSEYIQYMSTISDDNFKESFKQLLHTAKIELSNASLNGKEFIHNAIDRTPNGIGTVRVILRYYWSAKSFRYEFLDQAFDAVANSLSLQEYFEFESLLDWIQASYKVMHGQSWVEVKDIIHNHYSKSQLNPEFWLAWYKKRPLKSKYVPR